MKNEEREMNMDESKKADSSRYSLASDEGAELQEAFERVAHVGISSAIKYLEFYDQCKCLGIGTPSYEGFVRIANI